MADEPRNKDPAEESKVTQVVTRDDVDPLIGIVAEGYLIKARIGQGGMGQVYLAWDQKLEREVALKFLPDYLTQDATAVERLKREARAAAKLEHSNVVSILGIGEEGGRHFITMQYVQGGTLEEVLEEKGPMAIEEAMRILREICSGLQAAHKLSIVHRDVKPENIMLDQYDTVKINDFGLAISSKNSARLTIEGQVLGTPYIMSPEQCDGKEVDHRSDIYSLGITFFRMLTGKWPHDADTAVAIILKHLQKPMPNPVKFNKNVPAEVVAIVKKLTAKLPDDRYQNLSELIEIIDEIKIQGYSQASTQSAEGKGRSMRLLLVVMLLAVTGYAAYLKIFMEKPDDPNPSNGVRTGIVDDNVLDYKEAIELCLNEIDASALKLSDPKWMIKNTDILRLKELDEYKKNIESLKRLDPSNKKIADREKYYIESKRKIETDIAYEVIASIDSKTTVDEAVKEIRSLDSRLVAIQQVSNHIYAKYQDKIETILKKYDLQSQLTAQDILQSLWLFEVPYENKKDLLIYELKLREKQKEQNTAELNKKRLRINTEKYDIAKLMLKNHSNLDNALLLLKSCLLEADYVKKHSPELMTPQFYDSLKKDQQHWHKYNELRKRFFTSIENPNNFVYDAKTAEYKVSRQILENWRSFDNNDEVRKAEIELDFQEAFAEGKAAEADKNYARAFRAYGTASSIKPEHSRAANSKIRLEKQLDEQSILPTLQKAEFEIKKGNFDLATRHLKDALSMAKSEEDKSRIAKTQEQINSIVAVLKNVDSFIKAKNWSQVIKTLQPLLKKHPLSKGLYNMSQAYKNLSLLAMEKKDWKTAFQNIEKALKFQEKNPELLKTRGLIIDSWVNETVLKLTESEKKANKHIVEGHIQLAVKTLSGITVENPEVRGNKVVVALLLNIKSRRAELGVYDDWIKKTTLLKSQIDNKKSNDWKTCLEYLKEAEKIGSEWKSFIDFKKSILFDHANMSIQLKSNNQQQKLAAHWSRWLNRPEKDLEAEKILNAFRISFAGEQLTEIDKSAELYKKQEVLSDHKGCQKIIAKNSILFSSIKLDFAKTPKLGALDLYVDSKKKWSELQKSLTAKVAEKKKIQEAFVKYKEFLTQATKEKSEKKYRECLNSLKNALAHATEERTVELKLEIEAVQKTIETITRLEIKRKRDAERIGKITKILAMVAAAEKELNWQEALVQLAHFGQLAEVSDNDLIPKEKKTLVNWRGNLKILLVQKAEFEEVLAEALKAGDEKGISKLQRFIKTNQGHYYVTQKIIQNEIEKIRLKSSKAYSKYKYSVIKSLKALKARKAHKESRELLKKAINLYPTESDFHKALIEVLHNDRITFDAGEFRAGSEKGEGVESQERPAHKMIVKSFSLSRFEVSNIEWLYFVKAKKYKDSDYWKGGEADAIKHYLKPIQGISYKDAVDYAKYISDGCRLPNEHEWEFAARGGGQAGRRWPWGNTQDKDNLNISGRLTDVDSFEKGASSGGLQNMAGNVSEWTASEYVTYPSTNIIGQRKKPRPLIAGAMTIRGGSMYSDLLGCRSTARQGVKKDSKKLDGIGLRLCWDR